VIRVLRRLCCRVLYREKYCSRKLYSILFLDNSEISAAPWT